VNISAFDIKHKYDLFISNRTIYSYLGSLTQKELDHILERLEAALSNSLSSRLAIKKIYNILVEGVQNIFGYLRSKASDDYLLESFVFVNEVEGGYKIITGNFMRKQDIKSIESRIQIVNSLDANELKDLYRGVLDIGGTSEGGGAGLGFIDMAKKSTGELIYNFDEVDDKHVFFTLEMNVEV
jgi:hypothetical protein